MKRARALTWTAGPVAALLVVVGLSAPASGATTTQDLADGLTPTQLAEALAGSGVTVSNVTYSGTDESAGTFTESDASVYGVDEGVVLTSGWVDDLAGPNDSPNTSRQLNTPGDAELTALAGFPTFDATVLQFDFVPDASTVYISYVFASEEYNEYANSSFNDVFAFYVNGANCATVDGDPVTINTINGGRPLGTDAVRPDLYRNNDDGAIDIEPDGLTVVLVCEADVTPNATNTMKLAIADGSDSSLDSWVLLSANGITTTPPESCNDGIDNDGDGFVDGDDPDCAAPEIVVTADAGPDASGIEGSAIALTGSGSSTGGTPSYAWTYTPVAADAGATCTFADATAATTTITCTDDGEYTVTLTATDGAISEDDAATVTVSNADPSVAVTAPVDLSSALVGATVSVTAPFTDAGSNDTHTCLIDWGDGSTSAGTVSGGQCTATHSYSAIGVYDIVVTVTDDDAGDGSATVSLTVYDQQTKVTGGGFVAGSGRTSFGFVASSGPLAGQIQVRLPGKHTFHGDSVTSLSVVGNTATWAGSGRYDNTPGYSYTVTVVDNQNGGGKSTKKTSPDTISITIKDAGGATVYALTTSALSGGNIKVH